MSYRISVLGLGSRSPGGHTAGAPPVVTIVVPVPLCPGLNAQRSGCRGREGVRGTTQGGLPGWHSPPPCVGRRAPPGKCRTQPAQVKARSRLIRFVPKESKCLSARRHRGREAPPPGAQLLLHQIWVLPAGPGCPSWAPTPSTGNGTQEMPSYNGWSPLNPGHG